MLLQGAIGDAYGAGFEFAERAIIDKENNLTHYRVHPRYKSIYKKYTDDTQMALALAELLIEQKDLTRENIADKFVEVFKRDVREGYASRFYQFLLSINSGAELLEKIIAKSERNGAAMRAYPLGILKTASEIIEANSIQMAITHNTEVAKIASEAIALTSHFFIYNKGTQQHLKEYLSDIQHQNWSLDWQGEVTMNAIETVEAVLTILTCPEISGKNETSLKNMLLKSVNFGGDVDTVASLTLAIGSQIENIENDLPKFLFNELENAAFGRDYLIGIDKQFLSLK
ncbi:MAG: ADP-ribosylglycohydrolase family protein [Saprospiraceae bacterium]